MKTLQIQIARFDTVTAQVADDATPAERNEAAEAAAEAAGPGWVVVDTVVEGEADDDAIDAGVEAGYEGSRALMD